MASSGAVVRGRTDRECGALSLEAVLVLPVVAVLVIEYGLLAVVAATIAGVLIQWATNGAIVNLFNALIDRTRGLIGA